MGISSYHQKTQSLGECLVKMRAGDPCPCCGSTLHGTDSSSQRRGGGGALVCVKCGCELTEVRLPFETGVPRVLSPAA